MVRSALPFLMAVTIGCAARQATTVPAPGPLGATISNGGTTLLTTFTLDRPHSIALVRLQPDGQYRLWTDPRSADLVQLPAGRQQLAFPRPGTVIRAENGPPATGGVVPNVPGACFTTPPLGGRTDPGFCASPIPGSDVAGPSWAPYDVLVVAMPYPVTPDEVRAALASAASIEPLAEFAERLAVQLSRPGLQARWSAVPVGPLVR